MAKSLKEAGRQRRQQKTKPPSKTRLQAAQTAQQAVEKARETIAGAVGVSTDALSSALGGKVAHFVESQGHTIGGNVRVDLTNGNLVRVKPHQPYTGLDQVPHGLALPDFDPNTHLAPDLLTDSSPLPRTTKADADAIVQSIEEKRQTVRIVKANIGLNTDVVGAGIDYEKLKGTAIDYASAKVNNETKFINYQVAETNRDIAANKFDQAQEKLRQGEIALAGLQGLTGLIELEWEERKKLKKSQIDTLQVSVFDAGAKIAKRLQEISESSQEISE